MSNRHLGDWFTKQFNSNDASIGEQQEQTEELFDQDGQAIAKTSMGDWLRVHLDSKDATIAEWWERIGGLHQEIGDLESEIMWIVGVIEGLRCQMEKRQRQRNLLPKTTTLRLA